MMNVYKYLQRIKVLDDKIQRKEERIQELKLAVSGAGAIRYDKEPVQTSISATSKLESMVLQYIDLEDEVEKLKDTEAHWINKLTREIMDLECKNHRMVLYLIYVEFLSYNQICKIMGVSRWTVYRMRDKAIERFKETHGDVVS